MTKWTLAEAIALCAQIEKVCPKFGCHVALTGGLLYGGTCKDLDILFYRIRQAPQIDIEGLWSALLGIGIVEKTGFGWCYKAHYSGKPIDCFFPEEQGGHYLSDEEKAEPEEAILP